VKTLCCWDNEESGKQKKNQTQTKQQLLVSMKSYFLNAKSKTKQKSPQNPKWLASLGVVIICYL